MNTEMPDNNGQRRYVRIVDTPEAKAASVEKHFAALRARGELNKAARAAGEPALRRLFALAEERDSGQIGYVARFLAGLYNGRAFPFDMTNFRVLDQEILDDCLCVLRMDAAPEKEVHTYFVDGEKRFRSMFSKFGIVPVTSAATGA